MDWLNLNADVNKIMNVHFTKGRSGKTINKVVIHYNAGDLTVEGCYNVWQTREASAHYQVESSGRIGQLVWDSDTAWHCGVWDENCASIGVEHANQPDGTVTDACLEAGAHLVASICKFYKLGRPEWNKNVFPHNHFSATGCPGQLAGSQNAKYMERAQYWYDQMTGAKPTPTPTPTPSKKSVSEIAKEVIAGKWGNGDERKTKLTQAGCNYDEVQAEVNKQLGQTSKPKMTARQFALEVWNEGKHGTGATRQAEAQKLGVDYNEAQRLINILASGGSI